MATAQTAATAAKKPAGAPRASVKKPTAKKAAIPAPKAPTGRSGGFSDRKVELVKKPDGKAKMATQARVILDTLIALKGKATQQEIIDALVDNGLKTRQEPKRIYTFYRQMLVDNGYIKLA